MKANGVKSDSKWIGIAAISVISAILFIAGTILAYSRSVGSSQPTRHPSAGNKPPSSVSSAHSVTLFAMGDSLTKGFADEKNLGYIGNLQNDIEKRGQKVTVHNIAINGLVSTDLVRQLRDPSVQAQIAHADIVAFSIGGNDLVHTVHNFTLPTLEQTKSAEQAYLANLQSILQSVRKNNPKAPIRMVGLYNPFLQFQGGAAGTAVVEDWNAHTSSLLRSFPDALMVPTLDLFTANGDTFLADDHFHPNSSGYTAIADRMFQDLPASQP